MPDPDQNGTLVSPSIDDELTVTIRLRFADEIVRDRLADSDMLADFAGSALAVARSLTDQNGVELASFEIALPTFRPYHTVYQRSSEPAPEIS